MPGINTTGEPNTDDYELGRGRIDFALLDATGKPLEYRHVGNAPTLTSNVTVNVLQHKSSRHGLKVVDKEVTIDEEVKIAFELDEINFDNLAAFFQGETAVYANGGSVAGVVPDALGNLYVIGQGQWYDLYDTVKGIAGIVTDTQAHRVYDITITSVKSLDGMTTYVLGTDYKVDLILGRIFVIKGGAMAGGAAPGVGYKVAIAADGDAGTVDEVKALTKVSAKIAIKFTAENAADANDVTEFQFHQLSVKGEGDFSLIGDQFTVMKFSGVLESNPTADADSPFCTIRHPNQPDA